MVLDGNLIIHSLIHYFRGDCKICSRGPPYFMPKINLGWWFYLAWGKMGIFDMVCNHRDLIVLALIWAGSDGACLLSYDIGYLWQPLMTRLIYVILSAACGAPAAWLLVWECGGGVAGRGVGDNNGAWMIAGGALCFLRLVSYLGVRRCVGTRGVGVWLGWRMPRPHPT